MAVPAIARYLAEAAERGWVFSAAITGKPKGLSKLVTKFCSQKQVPPTEEVFRRCSIFRALDVAEA